MPLGPLPPSMKARWADLETIVQVARVRSTDHISIQRAYYVTSHVANPYALARRIRDHWSIENQLHHCLDVSLNEDRRRIRNENGAHNFALVTRYALSLLKRDQTKMSVAIKRRAAAWGDTCALEVLSHGMTQV